MEKAAEVYTRLKSRVLGPKIEVNQKANKTGMEKDKGDVEKGQEKVPGGEAQNEKGEEETNAGNYHSVCWEGPKLPGHTADLGCPAVSAGDLL